MTNTILAGNTSPTDANLYNVGVLFSGPNNLTNGSPLLAPLANYGGPTATMPPLFGSPAIGGGLATALTTDQRGYSRPTSGAVDIGAVQTQSALEINPPSLINLVRTASGGVGTAANTFQFTFIGASGTDFSVLTTTNVAAPLASWTALGEAMAIGPGQFQFTDTAATNAPQRFYQVVSP
jgi:hypothetical protein